MKQLGFFTLVVGLALIVSALAFVMPLCAAIGILPNLDELGEMWAVVQLESIRVVLGMAGSALAVIGTMLVVADRIAVEVRGL